MLDKPEDVLDLVSGALPIPPRANAMPSRCKDCPFKAAEEGRDYLAPGRLDGIKTATLLGGSFHCHKTVYSSAVERETTIDPVTGDERRPAYSRHYRQCAGALDWAEAFAHENGRECLSVIHRPKKEHDANIDDLQK